MSFPAVSLIQDPDAKGPRKTGYRENALVAIDKPVNSIQLETDRLIMRRWREDDFDPLNTSSICVAARLGEKVEGKTELLGREDLIYGIDRPVKSRR